MKMKGAARAVAALLLLLGYAGPALAANPCDTAPPAVPSRVVSSPVTIGFCHTGKDTNGVVTTITQFTLRIGTVASTAAALAPISAPNAAGARYYQFSPLAVPRGTYTVTVTATNSAGVSGGGTTTVCVACTYTITVGTAIDPSWIQLSPGASIQAAVDSRVGATTFYLRTGTFLQQQVHPKAGNTFIGAAGAIMDGQNVSVYAFEALTGVTAVTIRNIEVRNYLTGAQRGAFQGDNGTNWVLEDLVVHDNEAIGIRTGPGWQVRRSTVYQNGVVGISGFRATNALIENNQVYANNFLQAPELPVNAEAAGIKYGESAGVTVRNNNIHDNLAKGLWMDHCAPSTLIEGNQVRDNSHQGIFIEITRSAILRNNIVERNGIGSGLRAGIHITNSPSIEIYGNTVNNNAYAIRAFQNTGVNATSDSFGPLRTENLYVHNNTVHMSGANLGQTGLSQNTGEVEVFTTLNNRYVANTYSAPNTTASWFTWGGINRTFASWQSIPEDATGTFTVSP